MVNPLLLDPVTEEIAGTQLVSPQFRVAPSPPDAVVPERMIEPVCPMLSRTVITLPDPTMEAITGVQLDRPQFGVAVSPPEAVAPERVIVPLWPPLSRMVMTFPEAVTPRIPAIQLVSPQFRVAPRPAPAAVTAAGMPSTETPNRPSTSPMRFAKVMVFAVLPANSRPMGLALASLLTISEPESPALLHAVGHDPITI